MTSTSLLTTAQAAEYLGVSQAFLERDRWAGAAIPFIRVGARAVRYLPSDLDAYVVRRRMARQSSAAGADAAPPTPHGDPS